MTNIISLDLCYDNLFTDSDIENLTNLIHLNLLNLLNLLCNKKITDNGLKNLIKLSSLHVGDSNATSECIKHKTNLTHFNLGNQIMKDDELDKLTNLVKLNISWNRHITDDGIKNLTKLTYFDARIARITYDGLENLTNLVTIDIYPLENITRKIEKKGRMCL